MLNFCNRKEWKKEAVCKTQKKADMNYQETEKKWQKVWEEKKIFSTPSNPKKKYYVLEMFAYPSGDIHIGHFRNYTIGDAVARFKKKQGWLDLSLLF